MIKIDFTTKSEITHEYIADQFGNKCTYNDKGQLHSYNDQPAAIRHDGTKLWYKHGKLHRDNDLPAVIYSYLYKEYWFDGKLIREELS